MASNAAFDWQSPLFLDAQQSDSARAVFDETGAFANGCRP
jgi:hypothetical protein